MSSAISVQNVRVMFCVMAVLCSGPATGQMCPLPDAPPEVLCKGSVPGYLASPSNQLKPMGFYSSGLAVADMNGDGRPDLVASNGLDMSPQPLAIYYNRCDTTGCINSFDNRATPDWFSSDFLYYGGVAVGDLDGDGCNDLAVSVLLDRLGNPAGSGIRIYHNRGKTEEGTCAGLAEVPSQTLASGKIALACSLGDADGDADLDLAVAVAVDENGGAVPALLFNNNGGNFHENPSWSPPPTSSTSVLFADADQDGLMDLVLGGEGPSIYYGASTESGSALGSDPEWHGVAPEGTVGAALAVAKLESSQQLAVAASYNSGMTPKGAFPSLLYLPKRGDSSTTGQVWQSTSDGLSSALGFADLNADHEPDLVITRWCQDPRAYLSNNGVLAPAPAFCAMTGHPVVDQSVVFADLRRLFGRQRLRPFLLAAGDSVIQLPEATVSSILLVTVNGQDVPYARVPQGNWLSLAADPQQDRTVLVTYFTPLKVDLLFADWQPNWGVRIHLAEAPKRTTVRPHRQKKGESSGSLHKHSAETLRAKTQ